MSSIHELLPLLRGEEPVYIQTHNFPDHDAVAAAFALQYLLAREQIETELIYEGEIQRSSLAMMIEELGIDIRHSSFWPLVESDKIVVVDGCKGNKNVTDLIGDEVGVIDHHQVIKPEDVPFADIRPDFGSCCTVVYTYFGELNFEIPQPVATALMIGINMDTALLTRGVGTTDIEAYADLYGRADMQLVNSILRNQVQTRDLAFFKVALERVRIHETLAFCYFPEGCNQNLLGILGDFFLSLVEVDFVALCARNGERINFSLRSEVEGWNSAKIIQQVLAGIGFGGGHFDRAGGIVPNPVDFDAGTIYQKFLVALGLDQASH